MNKLLNNPYLSTVNWTAMSTATGIIIGLVITGLVITGLVTGLLYGRAFTAGHSRGVASTADSI